MPWKFWTNEKLYGTEDNPIACDTETTIVDLKKFIPDLVLLSASDGHDTVIVPHYRVSEFLSKHLDQHLSFFNIGFDFWVIHKLLPEELRKLWWDKVENKTLHDGMTLEMLVRLANGEAEYTDFRPINLQEACTNYQCSTIPNKTDEYRMRYSELLEVEDWTTADYGFFNYAANDVISLHELYSKLFNKGFSLVKPYLSGKDVYQNTIEEFGLLSENIQVKGSIAIAQMIRNGIKINLEKAKELDNNLRSILDQKLDLLKTKYVDIFHKYKKKNNGDFQYTKKSKMPKVKLKKVKEILTELANKLEIEVPRSTGKKKDVSIAEDHWIAYKKKDPFLDAWFGMKEIQKLLSYTTDLVNSEGVYHCYYNLLMKTGRLSCENPPLQQYPKAYNIRSAIVPEQGYKLFIGDYSGIELRTLATCLLIRYGKSKLAEVFANSPPYDDAHSFTASMIMGCSFEDVLNGIKKEKKEKEEAKKLGIEYKEGPFSKGRQASKALNFGIPGGLAPTKLTNYAKTTYGVDLSLEDATNFRNKIIYDIYPELSDKDGWLSSSSFQDLESNLKLAPGIAAGYLKQKFSNPDMAAYCLGQVLKGTPIKKNGESYTKEFVDKLWKAADHLASIAGISFPALTNREGSLQLYDKFFKSSAITLTGRLRGGITYTERTNTPFQALASDGAKLAMYEMIKQGRRLVGMVHDELIVEIKENHEATECNQIMIDAMSKICHNLVPIQTEYKIANCWGK